MLILLALKWKFLEKAFSNVKAKTNLSFEVKVTERSNHSFLLSICLFNESRFSDIYTIMELKELNWLCKHMKNVRSSQPCISMNFSTEFSKAIQQSSSMWVSFKFFQLIKWELFEGCVTNQHYTILPRKVFSNAGRQIENRF